MELHKLTITQAHQGLVKREFSAVELTKAFLDRIEKLDKKFFAYLTITKNLAISQAKTTDSLILREKEIPILAGIPLAVKDNILVEDVRCTAASKILESYIAPYDATCIKKLKAQGAVILGKTNMDEFAMGSSCEHSAFGPTKNPHDLTRVPGGSSGGSAAAVAGNLCCYALGSDTCGSIRQPGSFCGVVGLKPTYGAVSRYGLIAMASSLDQIGPITKTVKDAKIVFDVISGKDPFDSTSVESKSKVKSQKSKVDDLRIGVPKEYFAKGIDPEVEKIVKSAIKKYEALGANIEEVSLPYSTEHALATYYIIMPSEVSANLARYDGIKYGYSVTSNRQQATSLLDVYLKSRAEGFGEEVRRRIMLGTYALSAGYYEAYYLKAQKIRTLIRKDFERVFKKVDVLMTPTSPTPAFKLGEKIVDPLLMYLSDIYMGAVNLVGLPAVSIPCGKVTNLPVGLQIIGKPFEEDRILDIAGIFEKSNCL
ncbi:Asp-tRNA(Asn)/Glu-tRNA(Gln) amidotransferase subunit GatA [Patescibacteria group bacterium]|nr:Asp-tRNA(Asn)/Glu-tRNA(Gln) amidotransferase subunit GatA [Patescibacteria group bacterium]